MALLQVTNGIRVSVRSAYVPAQSFPGGSQYLFAYNIKITNQSQATVLLKSRYWLITDGNLQTQEVRQVPACLKSACLAMSMHGLHGVLVASSASGVELRSSAPAGMRCVAFTAF